MLNTGTLVGAPIRPNDSLDQYPAALQSEIKGGHHTRSSIAERDAIGTWLREAGMECYVIADGNTYELANDLVTWTLVKGAAGGSSDPGSGGDSSTATLISGNFGAWTSLGSRTTYFDETIELKYKADLAAFPSRAIVYLQGQFALLDTFGGTGITLGNVPANTRPAVQLKKYFIANNIEFFLIVETNGDVKLSSKDGLNLPTGNATQPYYIDAFWRPVIGDYTPTVYTATRSASFTRNNCGSGHTGTSVTFTKTYTSTVSQDTADNLADTDDDFSFDGQSYANLHGTCTVDAVNNVTIYNNRDEGTQDILFIPASGPNVDEYNLFPGNSTQLALVQDAPYTVRITNLSTTSAVTVTIVALHGYNQTVTIPSNGTHDFLSVHPTMNITLAA